MYVRNSLKKIVETHVARDLSCLFCIQPVCEMSVHECMLEIQQNLLDSCHTRFVVYILHTTD